MRIKSIIILAFALAILSMLTMNAKANESNHGSTLKGADLKAISTNITVLDTLILNN